MTEPREEIPPGRVPRVFRALLRFPLVSKILTANIAIVLVGAVAGTALTAGFVRATPERSMLQLIGLFALVGLAVSTGLNVLILRLALSPLKLLQDTAGRVQRGDLEARAPTSPLADRELRTLTQMFNNMLGSLATHRRRLKEMTTAARLAEENERKRIARELHDDTAQTLTSLLIRLHLARETRDRLTRDARLEEARDEIIKAIEGVRRLALGLRPPALETIGVAEAISQYADSLEDTSGLQVEIEVTSLESCMSPDAELALYRIVQEALGNAARHAGTETVRVKIDRRDGVVIARVTDYGCGFFVDEQIEGGKGLGIFGMRERAEYVGGSVRIESSPGEGTTVLAELPVNWSEGLV